ncbi:MAG: serine protease [Candidatus Thiodiazotropha sp. (ex. Lucinisca nassula)]|nr:serine protease [Candidatus Thiodiazotropha sp. (ex. Lucinisca nassula)]MBW9275367.1 serine protease [Candidatus Thiodiazotropha sp. (ex. Lucinisca nassula)]
MLRIFLALTVLLITGCQTTPVKTAGEIKTGSKIDTSINLPVNLPVAIYVDRHKPDKGINFYGSMKEAAKLVSEDFFSKVEYLKSGNNFHYLIKFKTNSTWEYGWGRWASTISVDILSNQGDTIYTREFKDSSGMTIFNDFSAVFNSQAKIVKESLIDFLNKQGAINLSASELVSIRNTTIPLPANKLIRDLKPSTTGTGFYLDHDGTIMTANHVVQDCVFVEIGHKHKTFPASIQQNSRVLDIAILSTDNRDTPAVNITDKQSEAILGKNIFVTGYPLQGILSDSPSLTIGTVSSLGGLVGASGIFMFSAPVQPGNSGSAIVDYSGNLVGMVTSSLNQKMLLEKHDTSSQNANFGIDLSMLKKFLYKNQVAYQTDQSTTNFENATIRAVEYTNQVLCYK